MTGIIKASHLINEVWDGRKRALENLTTELFRCGLYLALSPEFLPIETRFPPSGDELFEGIENASKEHFYLTDPLYVKQGFEAFLRKKIGHSGVDIKNIRVIDDIVNNCLDKDLENVIEIDFFEKMSLELDRGLPKIDFLEIDSFRILYKYCNLIAILLGAAKNIDLESLQSEIFTKKCKNYLLKLDGMTNNLMELGHQHIGYWRAKIERIRAGSKGGRGKTEVMKQRIADIKDKVEKQGKLTVKGFEINRGKWQAILEEVFGYNYVSSPTERKYKKAIEKQLSDRTSKELELILKK